MQLRCESPHANKKLLQSFPRHCSQGSGLPLARMPSKKFTAVRNQKSKQAYQFNVMPVAARRTSRSPVHVTVWAEVCPPELQHKFYLASQHISHNHTYTPAPIPRAAGQSFGCGVCSTRVHTGSTCSIERNMALRKRCRRNQEQGQMPQHHRGIARSN